MVTSLLVPVALSAGAAADASSGLPPVVDLGTGGEVAAAPVSSPTRDALASMLQQLDALQKALRDLRGQVEVQANEIERLKTRQRDLLADLDRRVSDLEHRSGAAPVPVPPVAASAAEAPEVPVAPAPAPAAPAPSGQEQQDYDAAFDLMKQGFYERAAKGFQDFIIKYPQSALRDNAQYWLGEAYYVVRNFRQALVEFAKVVSDSPKSEKAPDALLKIGYSYYELGDWANAHVNLNKLITVYPGTAAAESAELRIAKMKKEGH
ncbi:MAG: tol-pal system protein YbgF [Sulfuricaulis sp.]